MEKPKDIDSNKIREGLLLNKEQIDYLFGCVRDTIKLLHFLKGALEKEGNLDSGHFFIKKLEDDLKHCVTIIRKENDL